MRTLKRAPMAVAGGAFNNNMNNALILYYVWLLYENRQVQQAFTAFGETRMTANGSG